MGFFFLKKTLGNHGSVKEPISIGLGIWITHWAGFQKRRRNGPVGVTQPLNHHRRLLRPTTHPSKIDCVGKDGCKGRGERE